MESGGGWARRNADKRNRALRQFDKNRNPPEIDLMMAVCGLRHRTVCAPQSGRLWCRRVTTCWVRDRADKAERLCQFAEITAPTSAYIGD